MRRRMTNEGVRNGSRGKRSSGGALAAFSVESVQSFSDKASDEETIGILPALPARVSQ